MRAALRRRAISPKLEPCACSTRRRRDDLGRESRPAAGALGPLGRCAGLLSSGGEQALELVDRDEAPARLQLDRLDQREDAPVEARGADPERLGRLRPRVGEPLDAGRLAHDRTRDVRAARSRRVALQLLGSPPAPAT